MSTENRLKAVEFAIRVRARRAANTEFRRQFREVNPDHAQLLPRLLRLNGADLAGTFRSYFGVKYEPAQTWRANCERLELPPGAIPESPTCLKASEIENQIAGSPAKEK